MSDDDERRYPEPEPGPEIEHDKKDIVLKGVWSEILGTYIYIGDN